MAVLVRRSVLLVPLALVVTACGLLSLQPLVPLTEAQAVARAREAAPDRFRDEEVLGVDRLSYREVAWESAPILSRRPPTPDQCVFHVNLGWKLAPLNGQGVIVILDCFTGEVIHVAEWIS